MNLRKSTTFQRVVLKGLRGMRVIVSNGTGAPVDITIIAVSNVESERYKAYSFYDRVIIDNVFEYNDDKEIVKTFEKCAKNLYDVVDIDLGDIQA